MDGIEIPKDLLDQFRQQSQGSGTGSDGTAEPSLSVKSFTSSVTWLTRAADDFAKERGYTGIGKMKPEDFAELAAICAERNFDDWLLEKSPEAMFISMCLGILFSNLAAGARMKKEADKKAKEEKQSDEK